MNQPFLSCWSQPCSQQTPQWNDKCLIVPLCGCDFISLDICTMVWWEPSSSAWCHLLFVSWTWSPVNDCYHLGPLSSALGSYTTGVCCSACMCSAAGRLGLWAVWGWAAGLGPAESLIGFSWCGSEHLTIYWWFIRKAVSKYMQLCLGAWESVFILL